MAKGKAMEATATAMVDSGLAGVLGIPEGWELYLAYGADMDPDWMAGVCPSARVVSETFTSGLGRCVDAEGFVTICQENAFLEGTVWVVNPDEAKAMDDLVGVSSGSKRRKLFEVPISFKQKGKRVRESVDVTAFAYVSNKTPYSLGPGNAEHFAELRRIALKKGGSLASLDRITDICRVSRVEVEPMSSVDDYLDYVCRSCFRPLGKCACSPSWTRSLVHIDRGIQEVVATLNLKGYQTDYCCEGHSPDYSTYLSFRRHYGIAESLPVPEGFKYVKGRACLYAIRPKKASEEELEQVKAERLASLLEWSQGLPCRCDPISTRWTR